MKEFLKNAQLLGLLASMIWKTLGLLPLKQWVANGVEMLERAIKDSETQTDDVLLLPGIVLIRTQFNLEDIPDDQPINWSISTE